MGLDHGRLGVGQVYQKRGKCCKGGTGQWVLIMADWVLTGCTKDLASVARVGQANWVLTMADWVSAGCTKNVASAAKVGQADGVKCGRLGVGQMYKRFSKCCKEGMGR